MKLIHRYILTSLTSSTLYTLFALLGLYLFFDIVQETAQIGRGNYTLLVMAKYITLTVPQHAYELMPLAVLVGAMLATTQLVTTSEYTVIRISGISMWQLTRTLLLVGLLFASLTILLGEVVAPLCAQQAQRIKLHASRALVAQEFRSGIWIKDNQNFINIKEMLPDTTLLDIHVYSYDSDYRLSRTLFAKRATFDKQHKLWHLTDVQQTILLPERTEVAILHTMKWRSTIKPAVLDVLLIVPEKMSARSLLRYIHHLKTNRQKTQRYTIALWGKLFYPLSCVSMAMVALAFIPRQRRPEQLSLRLFIGICLGISFHFINRLFSYLGLLYAWNPAVTTTLPTLLFLLVGISRILQQERR